MASGKLGPRQKMINLMYLIFIAMLALNMSKEVLSAFGLLNERLADSNTATEARNTAFMNNLATKASEQAEQYGAVKEKADQISSMSNELDTYLSDLKTGMVGTLKPDETEDYEVQDKSDYLDQKLFQGDKLSPEGRTFFSKIA